MPINTYLFENIWDRYRYYKSIVFIDHWSVLPMYKQRKTKCYPQQGIHKIVDQNLVSALRYIKSCWNTYYIGKWYWCLLRKHVSICIKVYAEDIYLYMYFSRCQLCYFEQNGLHLIAFLDSLLNLKFIHYMHVVQNWPFWQFFCNS